MQFVMHRLRMSNYFSVIIVGLFLVACSYEIELDVKIDSECNVDVAFLKGLPQIEFVLAKVVITVAYMSMNWVF
ncbi:hypothetical protein PSSHI_28400 [Photobacterium sp. R1]